MLSGNTIEVATDDECMDMTCWQLMWLNPDYAPRLLWDTSMGQDSSKGAEVRDMMAKAFKVGEGYFDYVLARLARKSIAVDESARVSALRSYR